MRVALLLAILAGVPGLAAANAAFDKPLKVIHRVLPRAPLNPPNKVELECFIYPTVMIKETTAGEIGAEHLSLIPLAPHAKAPPCSSRPAKGEVALAYDAFSLGNFMGVKGPFVFLQAAYDVSGGEGLAVFDFQGRKLFQALLNGGAPHELHELTLHEGEPTQLTLRYRRLFQAGCSLYAEPETCWQRVRQATGLREPASPDCRESYTQGLNDLPPTYRAKVPNIPSLIDFDEETVIDTRGAVLRTSPLTPAFECWHEP